MSDPKLADEKTPASPSVLSPSTGTTFGSNFDIEGGNVRTPTWKSRLGFGEQPDVTREQVRQQRKEAATAIKETDTRTLETCPIGYPRLSGFLSSESNFSLYRSFSYLHSRVILELQDDLAKLERELDQLDAADDADGRTKSLKNRRYDNNNPRDEEDNFRPRKVILADIHAKLLEYDELMMKARDMQSLQRPSKRDYDSVRTWFWNEKPLQDAKEAQFIKKKEDIVSLHSGREWSGFDGFIEDMLKRFDGKLIRKIFCTREMRDKSKSRYVYYYSSSRVEAFVGLIMTSIVFILLVLPVVAMYRLTTMGNNADGTFQAIGVLVVFTLLFSAAMSLLTNARRHELFAAAAAYCAVLVVFISNFSPSASSSGASSSVT